MRTAIYTIVSGETLKENYCFEVCLKSSMDYALKIGADHIVRTKLDKPFENYDHVNYNVMTGKKYIYELLDYYDRVLYVDGDVLIKRDAENIFAVHNDMNCLYMRNENYNDVEYNTAIEKIKSVIDWPKLNGNYYFYNAGIILISKKQQELFNFKHDDYCRFEDYPFISDQPYINYRIFKYNYPIKEIGERFHAMVYFKQDGDFIHFANVHDRNSKIKEYNYE